MSDFVAVAAAEQMGVSMTVVARIDLDRMCRDVAPGHVAARVPPPTDGGAWRNQWCHLESNHAGPHRCGEWLWENTKDIGK